MSTKSRELLYAALISTFFLLVYYSNIWESYGFGEAGSFQLKGILGYSGITVVDPLTHPGYIILASAFYRLIGDVSFASIFSATTSALTIFVFIILGSRLAENKNIVAIFAIMLGFTHSFFWLATIPEVYSLHILIVSIEVLLFFQFLEKQKIIYLYSIALLSGFNTGVHQMEVFNALAIAITALLFSENRKSILIHSPLIVLAFLVGFSPSLYLVLKKVGIEALDLKVVIEKLFVGRFEKILFSVNTGSTTASPRKYSMPLLLISFMSPALLFAIIRSFRVWKPPVDAKVFYLVLVFVLSLVFALGFDVEDSFTYTLPAVFFMYLLAVSYFKSKKPGTFHKILLSGFILQPIVYTALPYYAQDLNLPQKSRTIPYRDTYKYYLHPFKRELSSGTDLLIRDTKEIINRVSEKNNWSDILVLTDYTLNRPLHVAKRVSRHLRSIKIYISSRYPNAEQFYNVCKMYPGVQVLSYFVHPDSVKKLGVTTYTENETTMYQFSCDNMIQQNAGQEK